MKRILITGGTGYLGSRLAIHFANKGYEIIALALNHNETNVPQNNNIQIKYLSDCSVSEIFKSEKIDIVIHTATLYGRNGEIDSEMLKANVEFPLSILAEALKHKCELFINTGTILPKNISPYAMTKNNFADWLGMYAGNIKAVNLKLDHFYGPNDSSIKFIARIIEQLKNNVAEINLTEGSQTRDFIYITDVINAFDCIVSNIDKLSDEQLNTFEAGSDNKTSIKLVVSLIKELLGNTTTKLNFGAIPYRTHEVLDYELNTTGLRLLGWVPQIKNVKEGLKLILNEELHNDRR